MSIVYVWQIILKHLLFLILPSCHILPCDCGVLAGKEVAVGLPVLAGHEDVDDGVDAGGQVDHDVAGYGHKMQGGVGQNLKILYGVLLL